MTNTCSIYMYCSAHAHCMQNAQCRKIEKIDFLMYKIVYNTHTCTMYIWMGTVQCTTCALHVHFTVHTAHIVLI